MWLMSKTEMLGKNKEITTLAIFSFFTCLTYNMIISPVTWPQIWNIASSIYSSSRACRCQYLVFFFEKKKSLRFIKLQQSWSPKGTTKTQPISISYELLDLQWWSGFALQFSWAGFMQWCIIWFNVVQESATSNRCRLCFLVPQSWFFCSGP